MSDEDDDFFEGRDGPEDQPANDAAPPSAPRAGVAEVDFWGGCQMKRIMTDPPRYELTVPSGHVLSLRTGHFFNATRFTTTYVDAVGEFPPLPDKKKEQFLQALLVRLLEKKIDIEVGSEASDHGTLLSDVAMSLASCPQSEDVRDIDRGALFQPPETAGCWVNARILMVKVSRSCPVKFNPGDFYAALVKLGLSNLDVRRHDGWRGRVWLVPLTLVPSLPSETKKPELPQQTTLEAR